MPNVPGIPRCRFPPTRLDARVKRPGIGWRVRYSGEERTVVDGPFAETKELVAGYTLIEVGRARRRGSGPSVESLDER